GLRVNPVRPAPASSAPELCIISNAHWSSCAFVRSAYVLFRQVRFCCLVFGRAGTGACLQFPTPNYASAGGNHSRGSEQFRRNQLAGAADNILSEGEDRGGAGGGARCCWENRWQSQERRFSAIRQSQTTGHQQVCS